jgi:hypothetical protein
MNALLLGLLGSAACLLGSGRGVTTLAPLILAGILMSGISPLIAGTTLFNAARFWSVYTLAGLLFVGAAFETLRSEHHREFAHKKKARVSGPSRTTWLPSSSRHLPQIQVARCSCGQQGLCRV